MKNRWPRIIFAVLAAVVVVVVIAFVVWRLNLTRSNTRTLDALRRAGMPTSNAELNTWYAAVPAEENAALVLTDAMGALQNQPGEVRRKLLNRGERLTNAGPVKAYLETNQTAAELIKMALERPRCRYSVNFSRGIYSTFPHLDGLRNLAQLPDYAAMLAAEGGDGHAAAEHIAQIAALARTLENEPILVSQLVRLSVLRIGVRRFERALSLTKFSDEDLRRLEKVFAAASGTNCMTRALIGERAWVISALRARDFGGLLSNPGAPTPKRPGASELILFPLMRISGFLERDLRFYLEYMDKIVTQSQPGPPRSLGISDITEAYATEARRKYYVFTGLTVPALARISRREAEGLAFLRLAETACAIERFAIAKGSFPGEISDLAPNFRVQVAADPFDGQLLRYKRLDDGYVLYSIGPDVHDDGGIEPKTDTNRRGPEDLVFKVVKK